MKYSSLTLLEELPRSYWRMRCDCGKEVRVWKQDVLRGHTKGCGCRRGIHARGTGNPKYKDGRSATSEYRIWFDMLRRCGHRQRKQKECKNYADRGIRVCDEWQSFENFYADMGPRPSKQHSIERIDNNGNYEPSNCRWASRQEQNNNRRNNRILRFNGEEMTMAAWSRKLGISQDVLESRLNRYGWPIKRAMTQPVRKSSPRRKSSGTSSGK